MADEIKPLSDNEKSVLFAYSERIRNTENELSILKSAFANLMNFALSGRGLSPETHRINEKAEIEEIKKPTPTPKS